MSRPENAEHVPVRAVAHVADDDYESAPAEAPAANPLLVLHGLLRGRYLWAALLAVLGAGVGAAAGYFATSPSYTSTGVLQIRPTAGSVMRDQANVIPMFDAYVESQVALIRSERVIAKAMETPEWQAHGRGMSPAAVEAFTTNLTAVHPKSSMLIQVTFTDGDPDVTRSAVKAVMDAYVRISNDMGVENGSERLRALEDRRTTKSNELKGLTERIASIANEVGSASVEQIHQFKLQELQKLESELKQVQLALASADTAPSAGAAGAGQQAEQFSDDRLAAADPVMRDYLKQRRGLELFLSTQQSRLGEKHERIVAARLELEQVGLVIAAYRKEAEEAARTKASAVAVGTNQVVSGHAPDVRALRAKEQNIRALHDAARKETFDLGRKALALENARRDADAVRVALAETQRLIEEINLNAGMSGSVSKVSVPDRPTSPTKDKRAAIAGGAGAGGAALGFGVILGLGLMNRRLGHVADAHGKLCQKVPLLGIFPTLPDDLSDPDQAAVASHSVHHIRTLLQLSGGAAAHQAIAVTSPSAGSGKTSLTLALGMSFAGCGSKTLMIDFDLIGGGLTAKVDRMIRPRLGRILVRGGRVDAEQLKRGLATARASKLRVGEALVAQGAVTEAQVAEALAVQQQTDLGLLDVVAGGEPLVECVAGTGVPNLYVLPLGSAQARHVGRLSPSVIRRVLHEAKKEFDNVIIDTGPILGSLEASMVTAETDAVVLVVSRGEQRALALRAMEQLTSLGARVAGVVFNRARREDLSFIHSSSSVAVRSIPSARRLGDGGAAQLQLGPIGSALKPRAAAANAN